LDDILKHSGMPDDHFLAGRLDFKNHNEYGFRTSTEMKENRNSILCLGCSFTYGQAVEKEESWPEVLGVKSNRDVFNLGKPGGSLDAVYRFLNSWLPILKSKDVCVLNCFRRREVYMDDRKRFIPIGSRFPAFLANTEYSLRTILLTNDIQYNLDRNKTMRAIKNLCDEFDSNLHFIDYENNLDYDYIIDLGTDGQHPGPKQQEAYAELFYDKIQNN